jgi:SAM-dependent methyltransferase
MPRDRPPARPSPGIDAARIDAMNDMAGSPATALPRSCWICGGPDLTLLRRSQLAKPIDSGDFRITDAGYGITGSIFRCDRCGFRQCGDMGEVLSFYEGMEDQGYEETRAARALQARRLVDQIARHRPAGSLLDIGAGTGILVEEALASGFRAEGIEPSAWLAERAAARGLPVHHGTLPHPGLDRTWDIVTLIDVVEHVTDPLALLNQMRRVMADGGIGVIVTPDVGSWAARLLGWRWWHYRIAHVGYFSRPTLAAALGRAGLKATAWSRPTWYLPGDYVAMRLASYLPAGARPPIPQALARLTVPLNLFDSLLVFVGKA